MKIDQETGLPEVPEGYFWRIRERRIHLSYSGARIDNGELWVELCRRDFVETTNWFGKRKEVEGEPTIVEAAEMMLREWLPSKNKNGIERRLEKGWEYSATCLLHGVEDLNDVELICHIDPTPENILKVATSVLEKALVDVEQQKEVQRKAQIRAKVIGTYPPRKLDS